MDAFQLGTEVITDAEQAREVAANILNHFDVPYTIWSPEAIDNYIEDFTDEEKIAAEYLNKDQTYQMRHLNTPKNHRGFPVLIRYPATSRDAADVTFFPGEDDEMVAQNFDLSDWVVVANNTDVIGKLRFGSVFKAENGCTSGLWFVTEHGVVSHSGNKADYKNFVDSTITVLFDASTTKGVL